MSNNTIKLEFPVEQVDVILSALGNEPFVKVNDLIQSIRVQAVPQWQALQEQSNPKPTKEEEES
jgi:hypothetical protein